jgi:hypothetical protein
MARHLSSRSPEEELTSNPGLLAFLSLAAAWFFGSIFVVLAYYVLSHP